ncbi:Exodeoxyribonuclease V beta chain [hydrothermal vent metagenome]|uniref:DNA 3'-5' helicase n=1 Tax=hydrothermal vent metagenome TaxID=652676 RepID=A0A3B1C1T4_9ZZZZ
MDQLNPYNAELSGLSLIEASAGTGKTYTITGLYVRLVLEQGYGVENILVVTFTNAATAELRDRIRSRLVAVLQAFEAGGGDNDYCRELFARCADHDQAIRRLRYAVLGFDQAAIFTIHGFCQRVLTDSAFESGMPFESELLVEQGDLLQEIVDDFWRCNVQDVPTGLADYLLAQKVTPEKLLIAVQGGLGKPYLEIRGAVLPADFLIVEAEFHAAFKQARELWLEAEDAVREMLRADTSLNGNKYRKSSLENWFVALDGYLGSTPGPWFEQFAKFSTTALSGATKKGQTAPLHPFFDACEDLLEAHDSLDLAYQRALVALKQNLLAYCDQELRARKEQQHVQSYDDLLLNLNAALGAEHSVELARSIRNRYTAVLIDEFQDTDPTQYQIFSRIYGESDQPVFLVGDPKQAIYSFRGADIFAYHQAKTDARQSYTLDLNWRSDPRLIAAVNALFDQSHHSFFYDWITFHGAKSPAVARDELLDNGSPEAPLRVWFQGHDPKPMARVEAEQLATRATAAEISRLLQQGQDGETRIGDSNLSGGDIAVLVRSHRQGQMIGRQLRMLGIHSVQQSRENVFHSHEAVELERVLCAVAEPGRQSLVMAALATDMLAINGNAIDELMGDEQQLEQHLGFFQTQHQQWQEHGFMRMFRHLLAEGDIAKRLLSLVQGERRLTNLQHLGELLHQRDIDGQPGMDGLIKWLSRCRQTSGQGSEEAELRLESDENLVQIVTIHKSKGLQYPIVFCPFLWDGKLHSETAKSFSFHDDLHGLQPVLELGSETIEESRPQAVQEEFAEGIRLLYVALTRAQHRCYFVWGNLAGAGKSALAWLLHPAESVPQTAEAFKQLDNEMLQQRLDEVVQQSAGGILVEPLPGGDGMPILSMAAKQLADGVRHLTRGLNSTSRVTSFTALASGHSGELPDYDAQQPRPAAERTAHNIFGFPRGARAGCCLHAIFEQLDFAGCHRPGLEQLVHATLQAHGFAMEWMHVIADMVERVLATPLNAQGLCLQNIGQKQRLIELEFYYPLAPVDGAGLRAILLNHGFVAEGNPIRNAMERLDFMAVSGFMKGFIDLVFEVDGRFYLVDYKSNWLGDEVEAYAPECLTKVIAREDYYLQYLFYTLALHRYLGQRLPDYDYDQHFGGVFYFFLRGMNQARGADYGVYQNLPKKGLIEALDKYLIADG